MSKKQPIYYLYLILIILLITNCNIKNQNKTINDGIQMEQEDPNILISTLVGEWKLDSVVFINDNIRRKPQIPFSTTNWSFTEHGHYIVKIQQNQYNVSILKDSSKQKASLIAEIPPQKYRGRYKHNINELITSLFGANTKYQIVHQSDTTLLLKSQRTQTPPITKKEEGQLAEHYFTLTTIN